MNEDYKPECEAIGNTPIKNEAPPSSDTTKLVGIYGLQNKLKPDKWNVGQSWDVYKRWRWYYKTSKCKGQHKLYNALLKYGYDGFEKTVLEVCPIEIVDEKAIQKWLDEREDFWIKHYNSIESGYNIRGAGSRGKMSVESKLKNSLSHIGKKRPSFSEEWRKNMSISHIGKNVGKNNGSFGKHWVTNGVENKKVDKNLPIDSGWRKGMRREPFSDEAKRNMSTAAIVREKKKRV